MDKTDSLSDIIALNSTRTLNDPDNNNIGLLWNLSGESRTFDILDGRLSKLEHSSRCSGEHPVAIVSERQLELVSFPVDDHIKPSAALINKALHARANMIGHVQLSGNEAEITSGFAGAEGNLIWFNTGECDLLLRLSTGCVSQSIILKPGFGFCLGRKEKLTRVFLSSINRVVDKFHEAESPVHRPHAMFFGCDRGDQMTWLDELNSDVQDTQFIKMSNGLGRRKMKRMKESDLLNRLGIQSKNIRRNQIRIAPMRGSNMPPDLLAGKVVEVEKWVQDTLRCVKSKALPKSFNVTPRKEQPQVGHPFDVLWVDSDFDDELWDNEVMWDIRFMGSKLDKFPGFPVELSYIREKLYMTRDGISERGRGPRMD